MAKMICLWANLVVTLAQEESLRAHDSEKRARVKKFIGGPSVNKQKKECWKCWQDWGPLQKGLRSVKRKKKRECKRITQMLGVIRWKEGLKPIQAKGDAIAWWIASVLQLHVSKWIFKRKDETVDDTNVQLQMLRCDSSRTSAIRKQLINHVEAFTSSSGWVFLLGGAVARSKGPTYVNRSLAASRSMDLAFPISSSMDWEHNCLVKCQVK
ncbi:hypothetical protein Tco_0994676 [Tanacetum coccineum]